MYSDLLTCYRCQQVYASSIELIYNIIYIFAYIVRNLKHKLGDYKYITKSPMYYSCSSAVCVVTLLIFQHLEFAVGWTHFVYLAVATLFGSSIEYCLRIRLHCLVRTLRDFGDMCEQLLMWHTQRANLYVEAGVRFGTLLLIADLLTVTRCCR